MGVGVVGGVFTNMIEKRNCGGGSGVTPASNGFMGLMRGSSSAQGGTQTKDAPLEVLL